jgi:type I restriction enzyme M protein
MPLTLSELKSHLWNCAEIRRGSAVDQTDWKAYILPSLFFKRICGVWDEEPAEASSGDADPVDLPEVHRFVVPERCYWHDVREEGSTATRVALPMLREFVEARQFVTVQSVLKTS